MTRSITLECNIHFGRRGRGARREVRQGNAPITNQPLGRVPRVSRLMALAIKYDDLVRTGAVADYAELARLGQVTRARITQIMNLRLLAPDIQEQLLFLPRVDRGDDPLVLRHLQSISAVADWGKQRRMWAQRQQPAT